jgi:hypothetical protein
VTEADLLALAESGAPLEEQREALAAALRERAVSERAVAGVLAHTRDGIVLQPADGDCRTCLGGPGLLPAGESWPCAAEGRPMTLIAVIDLGELPRLAPLPEDGTLLVFWDLEYFKREPLDFLQATRVFWVPPGAELQEAEAPEPLRRLPLRGVAMPIPGEFEKASDGLDDAEAETLIDALYEVEVTAHHLLGSSRDIQGPVLDEVQYWFANGAPESRAGFSEAELAGEGWMLLAQIDEDGAVPGMIFGDAGSLYLVMLEGDLRARRFDRVMGIMQCS